MKRFFPILSIIIFSLIFVFFPKSETFAQWPSFEVYCNSAISDCTGKNSTPYPLVDNVSAQGSASIIARVIDVSGVASVVANVEDPRTGHEGKFLNKEYPQVGTGIMYDDGNHNDCGPDSISGVPAGQPNSCAGDGYYGTFFDTSDPSIWTAGQTYNIDITATDLLENSNNYTCAQNSDCLIGQTCCIGIPGQTCDNNTNNNSAETSRCVDSNKNEVYYHITSFVASLTPEILSFTVPGEIGSTTISQIDGTISLKVPSGTDVTDLVPTFTLSNGATATVMVNGNPITQQSGVTSNDFTNSVTYSLTTAGSGTNSYIVTITTALSSEDEIVTFAVPSQSNSVVDNINHTVTLTVPYSTIVTGLTPTIVVSGGATINPLSGTAENFTIPKTYTVTAQDGSTQTYQVTVNQASNTEAQIKTFNFLASNNSNLTSDAAGTINQSNNSVTVLVPSGTNVTNLIPTITLSGGATVNPLSGTGENFTNSKNYIVTAQDTHTTQTYAVLVVVGNCQSSNGASVCISTSSTTNLSEISSFQLSLDGANWFSTLSATAGAPVTLKANLSGIANQSITFQDTTNPSSIVNIGTATTNSSGIATITYLSSLVASGAHTLSASYAGGSVPPSNASATLNITSAGNCVVSNGASVCISTSSTTNLSEISSFQLSLDGANWFSTLSATAGAPVTLKANLSGIANQSITFQDTTNPSSIVNIGTATTNSSGIATITYLSSLVASGAHTLSASYAGGSVPPSNASATLNITSAGNCVVSNGAGVCITPSVGSIATEISSFTAPALPIVCDNETICHCSGHLGQINQGTCYEADSESAGGPAVTFSAKLTDINGNALSGKTITFVDITNSNITIATAVTNSSGVATNNGTGISGPYLFPCGTSAPVSASCPTGAMTEGIHNIKAVYSGDSNTAGSTATINDIYVVND